MALENTELTGSSHWSIAWRLQDSWVPSELAGKAGKQSCIIDTFGRHQLPWNGMWNMGLMQR